MMCNETKFIAIFKVVKWQWNIKARYKPLYDSLFFLISLIAQPTCNMCSIVWKEIKLWCYRCGSKTRKVNE